MKKLFFILALCFSAFASAQCPAVNLPQNAKWKFNFSQCFGDTNTYTYVEASRVAYFDANKNLVYITYAQLADSVGATPETYPDSAALFVGSDGLPTTDSASYYYVLSSKTLNAVRVQADTLLANNLFPVGAFVKVGTDGRLSPIYNLTHSGNQFTQYGYNDSVIGYAIPRLRFASIWGDSLVYGNTPVNSILGRVGFTGGLDGNGLGLGGQVEVIAAENFTSTSSPGYFKISTTPSGSTENTNTTWYTHENSWQFGFPSPETGNNPSTFRIAIGSGNNAIAIYNLISGGSTYERGALTWSSNEFVLSTQEAGTGTGRNLRMKTPRGAIVVAGTTTTPVIDFDLTASGTPTTFIRFGSGTVLTSTSLNQSLAAFSAGFSASSGSPYKASIDINNTINLSGTYSGTAYGVWVHPTITAAPDYRGLQIDRGKVFFPIGSGAGSGGNPWIPASASTNDSILVVDASTGQVEHIAQPLAGSATLDFPNTNANEQADLTITVTGAADGDVVSLGAPNAAMTQGTYMAWVSASNTVTVRFHNTGGGAIDPASGTFKVKVLR